MSGLGRNGGGNRKKSNTPKVFVGGKKKKGIIKNWKAGFWGVRKRYANPNGITRSSEKKVGGEKLGKMSWGNTEGGAREEEGHPERKKCTVPGCRSCEDRGGVVERKFPPEDRRGGEGKSKQPAERSDRPRQSKKKMSAKVQHQRENGGHAETQRET